jgi:hypothetical protein
MELRGFQTNFQRHAEYIGLVADRYSEEDQREENEKVSFTTKQRIRRSGDIYSEKVTQREGETDVSSNNFGGSSASYLTSR